jgi:hypothetical protein
MARVHHVASSRTVHRCKQGHDIQPPEGYSWAAPGFRGSKRFACNRHPFRPSELTTSAVSEVLAAQEALEDEVDTLDTHEDFTTAWDSFTEAVGQLRDTRQEALDAWENGNEQLQEAADAAEAAAGEAEAYEVPEFDGDEEEASKEPDRNEPEEPEEPDRDDFDPGEDGDTDYADAMATYERERAAWENDQADHDDAVAQNEAWQNWVEDTRLDIRSAIETVMGNL